MSSDDLPKGLFIKNRIKIAEKLTGNSLAILNSNDQMPRNGDQFFSFRQNSDLYYLTGIEQEKTLLLVYPGHKSEKYREVLFILKADKNTEIWEGHKLTKDEAKEISGIQTVFWLTELDFYLKDLIINVEKVYLNTNEYAKFFPEVESRDLRFARELKKKFPHHQFERLAPLLTGLRLQKEPEEINVIEKAVLITNKAYIEVLKILQPGLNEREIEALLTYQFIKNGASGHAYQPIVATGVNACYLHYTENNKTCKSGQLLLMDFGAEYMNYAADCTRTIPVNGKFTNRQKEIYNSVHNALKFAMGLMKPGMTINKLNRQVNKFMEQELLHLNLITLNDIENQSSDAPAYTKYFMHGTSHFIGLDVHDVGSKDEPFKPGMVLSCEPGIYIFEEKLGVRLEEDILITKKGNINLTSSIPIEIEEIEKYMNKI